MSDGEVKITLDGEDIVLRPTFKCFRSLMEAHGNLSVLIQQIPLLNPDMFRDVIIAGAGKTPDKVSDVEKAIFATGLINLIEPLTRFVIMLGNGGKSPEEEAKTEGVDPNVE